MCFAKDASECHIRILADNTTAVAYINKQGGRVQELYSLALDIWQFAIQRNIWLSAAHLPGALNHEADKASRDINKYDKEWQLSPNIFLKVDQLFGPHTVDLFASRVNCQVKDYVSWQPDPGAIAVNAFHISWDNFANPFLFPPFSCMGRTLQKCQQESNTVTLVAPIWPSQPWFTTLLRMTVSQPALLPSHQLTLHLPHKPQAIHPLADKIKLAVFRVSGDRSKTRAFHTTLPRSSSSPGGQAPRNNIQRTRGSGHSFVVAGKELHLLQL